MQAACGFGEIDSPLAGSGSAGFIASLVSGNTHMTTAPPRRLAPAYEGSENRPNTIGKRRNAMTASTAPTMPIKEFSPDEMRRRVARFRSLKYPPDRYPDSQLPGHVRKNFLVIG